MAKEQPSPTAIEPICALPLVGATTVEDAVFYTAVGAVAVFGLVSWPAAALIGTGHALHQRARNVVRSGVVRSVEDPLFGPVVSFGVGGDATDLLGDYTHRIPPLTTGDVHDIVRCVRAAPKLFGPRGARPADVAALEDVVARVSCLADDLPEVAELELNPVVVAEQGAHVLGAVVRLASPEGRPDAGRRELTEGC